ncbi:MAG TPA: ABC transporter ATP-binding protein [Actinomycetota bacterium]|jgi:ABC-type lipoprotein export system ATPase subunit
MVDPGVGVSVEGLRHSYRSPAGALVVLNECSLEIPPGGYCALTGPSGSGKSTLLALLGGLDRVQAGTVRVGAADLAELSGDGLAEYRRSTVGFVFQHFGLLDPLTAAENVELANALAGVAPASRRARAAELLDEVGLGDRGSHRPVQLSGGERQRVAIARALANGPRLLLADEPTGNLDPTSADLVIRLLETVHEGSGCTLLVVTHNRSLTRRAGQRLRLADGRVVGE